MLKGYYNYKPLFRKYKEIYGDEKIYAEPYDENKMKVTFNDEEEVVYENKYFVQLFEYDIEVRNYD